MSESNQPHDRSLKDPVRVVYHNKSRTFARLFTERSLEEVKDVVRYRLGLGRETDVSLKQMEVNALIDLEDDDDFRAFCVHLKSSNSVDIQVTVGSSKGSTVPRPVAPQPREQPSAKGPIATSSASPSRQPAGASVHPEVARTAEAPATTVETPTPSARKRKVSFGDAPPAAPDKSAEQRAPKKHTTVAPAASAEAAETPATPKPVGAEPPKKRRKKEVTKAKDVQTTEAVETPSTKTSSVSKPKPRKSVEAGMSAPKDAETSESTPSKQKKQKKDDSTPSKKSSAPIDQDDIDEPTNPPNPVNEASLQSVPERPRRTTTQGSTTRTRKSAPKGTACAAIPRTSESSSVQIEVAAAILSGYLSKTSETIPPEPPAKRKPVKRTTKRSSTSSRALPVESMTVLYAPVSEIPNVRAVLTSEQPQQAPELNGPPCPICSEVPFHIRYYCPTVLKGADAIRERLEELKRMSADDQQSLIKELEGLLHDSKVTPRSKDATPSNDVQPREFSPLPNASLPRTPNIPSNSYLSEVTVENRNEGSSSESSDDAPEGGVKHKELPAPRRQQTPDEQPSPANDDLEAAIRGPASKRKSILHFIDRIVGDEDDEESNSEEDKAELEDDPDEGPVRSMRRLSRRIRHSSDSESEDEESRSPSPSRSAAGTSNNPEPGVQCSNKPAERFAERQESNVVMRDSIGPLVLEAQNDDSSEKTHVGSEDRMVVDHESIGEKDAVAIVEQVPSSPTPRAPVLLPFDPPCNEPQESGQMEVDPALNRNGSVPVASEVPNGVEADPIEPSDDLEPPTISRPPNADPIEVPYEDTESLFTGVAQSTPKPGVTKRIKTRNGQILDDEAERPVLLEQLALKATDRVTPLLTKGKSRRKITETPVGQEPTPMRKSPRFSSVPPSTSTPAAVVLLNHKAKVGTRIGKTAKTPAKRYEERPDTSQSSVKDAAARNGTRIAATPSLVAWETLAEPSSPSLQLDEPSVRIDELMSSSPQLDDDPVHGCFDDKETKGRSRKSASSRQTKSTQAKERLFDLSSSQIPFPYSQRKTDPAPTAFLNGQLSEGTTDSEEELGVSKKKATLPARYRSLSQLASQATLFSPSLPTPTNKSVMDGKGKKRIADEDSSSSSSDADEANGSEHIPRGRRAGTMLEGKKKKSLLSRI